jgi:hypothetical protein
MKQHVCVLLFFILLSIPLAGFAQLPNLEATISFDPPYPQPGEEVLARVSNLPSQLNGQPITWRVNTVIVPEAANERVITLIAPSVGESLRVIAQVGNTSIGNVLTTNYLDVIIEPQTRVPAPYIGRAVPSAGSQINATVLVNGTTLNPANLQYSWQLNNKSLDGGPIRGKYKNTFTLPQFEDRNILTVTVSLPGGEVLSSRSIFIPIVAPEVLFYEFDPLLGLASRPLLNDELPLLGNSLTVRAEPYYLDTLVFNEPDILTWEVNNVLVNNASNPYEITLQRQFGAGRIPVSFGVTDTTLFLQSAYDDFIITY